MKRGCTAVPLFYRFYKNKTKGKKSLPESTGMNFSHDTDGKSGSVRKKEVPQCILLNGVFTLEAAVVLPLLAAFFVAILFFFRVMQVQLTVENALNRSGRLMAVYAAGENGGQVIEKTGTVVATAFLVKELKGEPVIEEYVRGGTFGIYLLRSTFKGQEIHLVAQCYMKLPGRKNRQRSSRSGRMRDLWMPPRCCMWREPEISVHMALTITVHCAF